MAQQFIFIDKNNPESLYWGNLMQMRGCKLEGGDPERCYESLENKPILQCPQSWWKQAWDQALGEDDDYVLTLAGVFSLEKGDCIFDKLKIEDEKYPELKWVIVKEHNKDADLLYMVPFFESDPYGKITDPDWEIYKETLSENFSIFAEDPEGQDHYRIFTGKGTWVHREDLIGLNRSYNRDHLVKPACQNLSDLVSVL